MLLKAPRIFNSNYLLERDLATSECLAVKKAVSIMDVSGGQNKTAPQLKIVP